MIAFGWLRVIWIPKDCNPCESGDSFLEHLQPLGADIAKHHREPGNVYAWMREVRDQAGSDWIGDDAMTMGRVDVARLTWGSQAWCPRPLHRLCAESGRRPTRQPFCSRHRRNATRSLRLVPRCSQRPVVPAGTPALPCYPMKPSREGPRRVRAMQDAAHRRRRRENSNHRVTLLASHQDRRRILRQLAFDRFKP